MYVTYLSTAASCSKALFYISNLQKMQKIKDLKVGECVVVVSTYSQLMSNTKNSIIYQQIDWAGVVLDEGHKIKNKRSQTNSNVHQLKSNWRLMLTGNTLAC